MFKLYNGDCLEVLRKCPDNYIDAIVTDPPYGLSFMGKKWDYDVPSVEIWKECLRVLKPGGHLLAFGGTRTYHRLVVAIEDAGFEIRDQIQWIYGQGFPKSQDISKAIDKAAGAEATTDYIPQESNKVFNHGKGKAAGVDRTPGAKLSGPAVTTDAQKWSGWGTALKPANEPVCLARKPLSESTIAKNVLKWGTGGLNIDGTRIGIAEGDTTGSAKSAGSGSGKVAPNTPFVGGITSPPHELGRFPSNVILDEAAAQVLDGQVASEVSRFFYVAKASTSDSLRRYDAKAKRHRMEHVMVWEASNGPIPEGFDIHHKDGNKLNNDLSNLECISKLDHKREHSGCYKNDRDEWIKPCRKCGAHKPIEGEYYKRKDGISPWCRACCIANATANKRARKERQRA